MTEDNLQANIAKQRELVAATISDIGIYRSVVENIINLDADPSDKIDLLLEAVPDIGIIITQLSLCKSRGLLTGKEYQEIMNQCMLNLQQKRKPVNFNPNFLAKFKEGG